MTPAEPPPTLIRPGVPDREVERFALDADVTVYWPWVRPCWEGQMTLTPDAATRIITDARAAAALVGSDAEAVALAEQITRRINRLRAQRWEPYPWQHPHLHPDGWVSQRAPGVCDERCYQLPAVPIPAQGAWLGYGGRGTGKTEEAARYVNEHAEGPPCDPRLPGGHRIVIIAPTQPDAVDSCVTGPSGLQTINPDVKLVTTKEGTLVRWPNRARARVVGGHSPDDVERLRAAGNTCVAQGTLIATEHGRRRVENVRVGDRVWTRTGLRTVVRAEPAGVRPVMRLGPLWLTGDHPVARPDGTFSRADTGDGNVLMWAKHDESSTTASRGTNETAATGRTADTDCSTGTSMSVRSDRSPTAGTFITTTSIPATTSPATSSLSTLTHTETRTDHTTVNGTSPAVTRQSQLALRSSRRASSAASTGPRSGRAPSPGSAHRSAVTPAPRHEHTSSGCAACAARRSPQPAGHRPGPVPRRVAVAPPTLHVTVYDLAVEGHHEFYADGVLVGNCLVWVEEAAAIRRLREVLDISAFGLRVGNHAHYVITSTPKNRPEMVEVKNRATVITKGRTRDAHRLPADVRRVWEERFGGTTLGRQELDAEELQDIEGALWVAHRPDLVDGEPNRDDRPGIENTRVRIEEYGWRSHNPDTPLPHVRHLMQRVIVGVDPPGGRTEAGIVVNGAIGNHGYTLADLSIAAGPDTWARRAIQAVTDYGAIGLAVELTYGGDNISRVIESAAEGMGIVCPPIFPVPTKVGKKLRAEPIVALYQQSRWHHVGYFPELESEQTAWVEAETKESPNRLDAHVHAATWLLISARSSSAGSAAKRRIPGR